MWLVDHYWIIMPVIMSFTFTVNIICNNLLLAIVYGDFCAIFEEKAKITAELRIKMLDYAFDILCKDVEEDYLSPQVLIELLRDTDGDRVELGVEDGDYHEMMIQLIDNKTTETGNKKTDGQDQRIDREDLHELLIFWNCPMRVKPITKPAHRHQLSEEMFNIRVMDSISGKAEQSNRDLIEWMNTVSLERWCATFPTAYHYFYEFGAMGQGFPHDYNPWQQVSLLDQAHSVVLLVYTVFSVFTACDQSVSKGYTQFLCVVVFAQSAYVLLNMLAEMRRWQAYHFVNPNTKRLYKNLSNCILVGTLWVEFLARCSEGVGHDGTTGCFAVKNRAAESTTVTICSCVSKTMLLLNFMVCTPSINVLINSISICFKQVTPICGFFLAIYWVFAGIGISMFCGKLTQSVETGGPGLWATPANLTNVPASFYSPASGVRYDETMYGSNPYYYNLNYNGYPQAIASLYAVMIMNNWNVNANGPIEITSRSTRWFFLVYLIVVAYVMMNILVGAIIDGLCQAREMLVKEQEGIFDPLESIVYTRVNTTMGPSGRPYSDTWEVGLIPLQVQTDDCIVHI